MPLTCPLVEWGPGPRPRHVAWLGIELATVWFAVRCSPHWATPARAHFTFINVLNFDEVQFIYFFFGSLCLWCHISGAIAKYKFTKVYLYVSSKSFVTLPLTFRSVIHFALCLHMVWGRGPTSFFSGYPLVPLLCVAKTVLPPIKWCTLKVRVYFWTLHPNWLIWVSVFMPITHYLDYSNSAVKFEIGKCEPQLCSAWVLVFPHSL